VAGWSEHINSILLWHWIWLECGKPNTGYVYSIMKKTRHKYHYAVRNLKKQELHVKKLRLPQNIDNSVNFWRELKKLDIYMYHGLSNASWNAI